MEQNNIIIYNTEDGKAKVVLYAQDGNIWMNQNQMAELFDTSKQNIGQHIANILSDNELSENSVVKNYFTTASDGKNYNVTFYSLDMILAIGFRVRSKRGTQFRIWANRNLKEYMVKGFVVDDERLKNPDGRPDYFDVLLDFQNKDVLKGNGSITNKQMELYVDEVYEDFNNRRKIYAAQQADKIEEDELRQLESEIKKSINN